MKRRWLDLALPVALLAAVTVWWLFVPTTTTHTTVKLKTVAQHAIIAGPSRSECAVLNVPGYGVQYIDEAVASFDALTGTTLTCLDSYLNGAPTWNNWVHPWITDNNDYGYVSWVNEDPSVHQLVLQLDLIPLSLQNTNDPLAWETACAAGDYNTHAVEFAQNMVKAGLGNSVIRLGAEANGDWETDFVGNTVQEQNLWAKCFDNEVGQMRRVKGEHFLFDWNPNATVQGIPYVNYYPGNKYVDIMGLDMYDIAAWTPNAKVLFPSLAHQPYDLAHFEAFAKANGKPMSFPEWGLASSPSGDDAQYIDGIGDAVETGDFAFQSYFDVVNGGTLPLSASATPQSLKAYSQWFGTAALPKATTKAPKHEPTHLPPKHPL